MAERITNVPEQYDPRSWRQIMRDLGQRFAKLERTAGPYVLSNITPTRTLDMGTATATEIGNFVATLVQDLQSIGRLE